MKRNTSATRALIGCTALLDGATLNHAVTLAGYSLKSAHPLSSGHFGARRVVVRSGRIVRVSRNAHELSDWMIRLGRKLAALQIARAA